MDIRGAIKSQYWSALAMLEETIQRCPADLWDGSGATTAFWHIAYHALFYTHLYLQQSEQDFVPWSEHRKDYQFLGPMPWPPHDRPNIEVPYRKDEILAYLTFCRREVDVRLDSLDLEAGSGFSWLPFDKVEHLCYTLRHLQHHTGELSARLDAGAGIEIDWVGMQSAAD